MIAAPDTAIIAVISAYIGEFNDAPEIDFLSESPDGYSVGFAHCIFKIRLIVSAENLRPLCFVEFTLFDQFVYKLYVRHTVPFRSSELSFAYVVLTLIDGIRPSLCVSSDISDLIPSRVMLIIYRPALL